jgi:hypothetical protein
MMGEVIPFPDLPSEQDDALMELSSGVGVGVFVHEDEDGSVVDLMIFPDNRDPFVVAMTLGEARSVGWLLYDAGA